ncbi:MAG: alpha/beta hydrolase [Candidatus Hydrogenedentes bacterium]|nr:alpha/beta hydrolase [Candidatus Hydrogenedentota bacterium]MBI3119235.1 alpha/beta hydrolase [Candidatus Hydrogenedentota bacterium]
MGDWANLFAFMFALWPWFSPDTLEIHRNEVFKVVDGQGRRLDVVLPANADAPTPIVLIVHGGMWIAGDKIHYPFLKRFLVSKGIACAALDYGLEIDNGFYGRVVDIKDALRWLRLHAEELNIDPNRVGMFGSSAGGHLAALTGFSGDNEGFGSDPPGQSSEVEALFLLYGVYDLENIPADPLVEAIVASDIERGLAEDISVFSPLNHIDGSEPPTHIIHGTADRVAPFWQAEATAAALEAEGVPVTLEVEEDMPHAFARTMPTTRPWIYQAVADFFEDQL